MLIEIKNWKTNNVIFSYDCEDNTIKKTVEEAVKKDVSLRYADLGFTDLRDVYLGFIDLRYANLKNANLSYANIRYAELSHAILRGANLNYTNLRDGDLSCADLAFARLSDANINKANLRGADLSYANLRGAMLEYAHFNNAILSNADLSDANLEYADLSDANLAFARLSNVNLSNVNLNGAKTNYPMNIPDGEFIAWKKIYYRKKPNDYVIVKLKILADSKRSRATTDKCRCDKALVLGFETLKGEPLDIKEVTNYNYTQCTYKVGEIVYADWWDDNRWNECSHGIHFFIDRQNAVEYVL